MFSAGGPGVLWCTVAWIPLANIHMRSSRRRNSFSTQVICHQEEGDTWKWGFFIVISVSPRVYGKGEIFLPQTRCWAMLYTLPNPGSLNIEIKWSCPETVHVAWCTELWRRRGVVHVHVVVHVYFSVDNKSKTYLTNWVWFNVYLYSSTVFNFFSLLLFNLKLCSFSGKAFWHGAGMKYIVGRKSWIIL